MVVHTCRWMDIYEFEVNQDYIEQQSQKSKTKKKGGWWWWWK